MEWTAMTRPIVFARLLSPIQALPAFVFVDETSWTPKGIPRLTESDFTPFIWAEPRQPETPDFSVGGLPIAFGLVQGTSCPTTSDCSLMPVPSEVDIDNWKVTVNRNLHLTLSVDEVSGPGRLPELDLELLATAEVYNAGPSEVSGNITVRFHLPKEALAGFYIPEMEEECDAITANRGDVVVADCAISGPLGPGASEAVTIPLSGISAGYSGTVRDGSTFTYAAGVLPFSVSDPDPANDDADEADVVICNPTGIAPEAVDDIMQCGDLGTGGTAGTGGGASMGSGGGGCSAAPAANGSNPWSLVLCLAGVAIWLRRRRS